MHKLAWLAAAAALTAGAPANAAQIFAQSYSHYGAGYEDTGGIELTDGEIADRHYQSYPWGEPYVGWDGFDPVITFNFADVKKFGSLKVWVDDFDGAAAVYAPTAISAVINGVTYSQFTIGAPLDAGYNYLVKDGYSAGSGGGTPFILNLAGAESDQISLKLTTYGRWTFASEVEFFGAVPEPATWAMMIMGFFGLGAVLRRQRREAAFA